MKKIKANNPHHENLLKGKKENAIKEPEQEPHKVPEEFPEQDFPENIPNPEEDNPEMILDF